MLNKFLCILAIVGVSLGQESSLTCTYYFDFCILDIDNPTGSDNFLRVSGSHYPGRTNDSIVTIYGAEARPGTAVNVPSIICKQFVNLAGLWMDGLGIKTVGAKSLSDCKKLNSLYLGENEIAELPNQVFDDIPQLELLDLAHNKLTSLPIDIFKNFKSLKSLYLDHNPLTVMDGQLFNSLSNLRTLWLSSCDISTLNSTWFTNTTQLEVLYLNDNKISDLQPEIFGSMRSLNVLMLSDNNLTSIAANSFSSKLDLLMELYVGDNQVIEIDVDFFEAAKSLEAVDFERNDCVDVKFEEFSKSRDENLKRFQRCFRNFDENRPTTVLPKTTTPGAATSIWSGFLRLIPLLTGFFVILNVL